MRCIGDGLETDYEDGVRDLRMKQACLNHVPLSLDTTHRGMKY